MKNLKYAYIYVTIPTRPNLLYQYLYKDPPQQLYFILNNILGFSTLAYTDPSHSFE